MFSDELKTSLQEAESPFIYLRCLEGILLVFMFQDTKKLKQIYYI